MSHGGHKSAIKMSRIIKMASKQTNVKTIHCFQHPAQRPDVKDRRRGYSCHPGERDTPSTDRHVQGPEGHLLRTHAPSSTPRT